MLLVASIIAFFPLNSGDWIKSKAGTIIYAACVGLAVSLTVPHQRRIVAKLFVGVAWALLLSIAIPLLWVSIATIYERRVDPTYGFALSWVGLTIHYGLPIFFATIIFSAVSIYFKKSPQ